MFFEDEKYRYLEKEAEKDNLENIRIDGKMY